MWFCWSTFMSPVWKFELHWLCYLKLPFYNCRKKYYWLGWPAVIVCTLWKIFIHFHVFGHSFLCCIWNGQHIWVHSYYVWRLHNLPLYHSSQCVTASMQKFAEVVALVALCQILMMDEVWMDCDRYLIGFSISGSPQRFPEVRCVFCAFFNAPTWMYSYYIRNADTMDCA